jgi:RNA polymerase sigma factor (sigma-70 family)
MDERDWLVDQFESHRTHLRAVAYRMLGSVGEAEDAVQEAWLRLNRSDADTIDNLGGWLTTVVARICLNVLRSRRTHPEAPLEVHIPDPIVSRDSGIDPEHEALLADSVGLALLVVLDTLTPAERLAFVLHDMFALPFEEVAAIAGRSPQAVRQLASRARRRVQGAPTVPDSDINRQREVVDAFFAAARNGDFDALVAVLDPDIEIRSEGGAARPRATRLIRGAAEVAASAISFASPSLSLRPVLVNGAAGVVVVGPRERPFAVMAFTVVGGRIVAIDALADPERLALLDLSAIWGDSVSARDTESPQMPG